MATDDTRHTRTKQTGTDPTDTSRRRWWVPAVAVVATVVIVVGVTAIVNTRDTDTAGQDDTQSESVQELLRQAADQLQAEGGEGVVPDEDQWLYRKLGSAGGDRFMIEDTHDTWVSFRDETDPAAAFVSRHFSGPGEIHRIYRDLPDDTAELVDQIYELAERVPRDSGLFNGRPDPYVANQPWVQHLQAFVIVGDLLIHGGPPPAVQAKLYRALAEVPGIVDDGLLDDAIDDRLTDGEEQQFRVIRWDWDFESIDWPDGAEYAEDWTLAAHRQIAIDPDTYHFRALRWHDQYMREEYQLAGLQVVFDAAIVDDHDQLP